MPLKSATAINSHAEGKNASVDVIVNILEARIGVATGFCKLYIVCARLF